MRRAHPRRALLSALILSGVAAAMPVYAQPAPAGAPSEDVVKRAEALFRSANQLYTDQKWAQAEAGFLAAWALNPTYDVAANLGHTQFKLQKYRDAAEHLAFALRNWPLIGKPEPRKLAQDRLDDARQFVAAVTVRVSEPHADVYVDGKLIGQSPISTELFVEPGTRVFEAKLAGRGDAKEVVQATKGGTSGVTLTLSDVGTQPPGGPNLPAGGPRMPVILTGAALGGAGIVLGAVFAGLSNAKARDATTDLEAIAKIGATAACGPMPSAQCQASQSAGQARATFANASAWSFIAGGAVGTATVIYALAAPRAAKASGFWVAPTVAGDGGGVVARGEW